MSDKPRILIVDDEKDIRFLLSEILTDEGYALAEAPHSEAAFAEITKNGVPDLVILDIWLENSEKDGMEILAELKKMSRTLPVLMISGHGNIEMAVKAIKLGAYDFIEKPFNTDRLLHLVNRAMETNRLRKGSASSFVDFIAGSAEMQAVHKAAQKAASGDARVLITGGWGTGRGHLARWIHQESARGTKAFIALNCTDADANRINDALAQAGEGTLLLKDVHSLNPSAQTALLSKLANKTDARIIATMLPGTQINADLQGRLAITTIALPSLTDRRADIPQIAASMLEGFTLTDDVAQALKRREWPGQLAELRAVCAMLEVRARLDNAKDIKMSHMDAGPAAAAPAGDAHADWLATDLRTARESFERWYFEHLMERFDGNVSKIAEFAGMDRTALHRKLKSLKDGDDGERMAS